MLGDFSPECRATISRNRGRHDPGIRSFLYLVAVMDWSSRAVLTWRLSNTMDVSFCVSALEEALARFGRPEIFNTDQGSQFTSAAFTGEQEHAFRCPCDHGIRWASRFRFP
jgi:putative transposase